MSEAIPLFSRTVCYSRCESVGVRYQLIIKVAEQLTFDRW